MLTQDERLEFAENGYFLRRGFGAPSVLDAMLNDAVALSRTAGGAGLAEGALVMPENNLSEKQPVHAEGKVSKVFRLHRRPAFKSFVEDPRVLGILTGLLGERVDCIL